jgi:thymidylate kinase
MNHPVVILEGPDAVGKTTLAQEFQRRVGARYIHMTLRKNLFAYQIASLRLALKLSYHHPVIIDRHWPSENVYAGVYRGGSPLTNESIYLMLMCQVACVGYIYCHLSSVEDEVAAHASTHTSGREMYEPDDRIAQVSQAYRSWWFGGDLPDEFSLCGMVARSGGMSSQVGCFDYNWNDPTWGKLKTPLFISNVMYTLHDLMRDRSHPVDDIIKTLRENYLSKELPV